MVVKSFGEPSKSVDEHIKEIHALVGEKFPLGITMDGGKIVQIFYETEWVEGGTIPVVGENGVTEYEEDFTQKKLTKVQDKKVEDYVKGLVEETEMSSEAGSI